MAKQPKKKKRSKNKVKKKKIKSSLKTKSHSEEELVIKVPKSWAKKAYVNKNSYQKNIITLLKKMMISGERKGKEFPG